jgi:hypothetical protein
MMNYYQKGEVKIHGEPQSLWLTASPMRVSAWAMPRWAFCAFSRPFLCVQSYGLLCNCVKGAVGKGTRKEADGVAGRANQEFFVVSKPGQLSLWAPKNGDRLP